TEPAEAIVCAREKCAGAAGRITRGIDRPADTKGVRKIAEQLAGEILAESVTLLRRDEPFENNAHDILWQPGKVAGIEILDERSKSLRRFTRPSNLIKQVFGK